MSSLRQHTLEKVIELYLNSSTFAALKDQKKLQTRLNWWREKYGKLRRWSKVTPAIVVAGSDILSHTVNAQTESTITPSTINRYVNALGSAMTFAMKERHIIATNPCHAVKRHREGKSCDRFLTSKEIKTLLDECLKDQASFLYPLVVLAIYTGGRQSELLNLKWENVDFRRRQITFMDTKNGTNRTVGMAPAAYEVLKKHPHHLKSNLVFPSATDLSNPVTVYKPWGRARKKAGLEDVRFHDLRHTTASHLAMSGASLHDIATVLGHRTLAMVQRYAHLTQAHTAKAMNTMADHIESS